MVAGVEREFEGQNFEFFKIYFELIVVQAGHLRYKQDQVALKVFQESSVGF